MSMVTRTLNGMFGGVTQRPAPLREDNRFTKQVNFSGDIVDGLVKRPNTEFVDTMESQAGEDAFIHTINTAPDEQFKVIFTGDLNQAIEIYDLEGNEYDVEFEKSGDFAYVNTDNPKKSVRCITIEDETYILNTNETVRDMVDFGDEDLSEIDKYCMAWIREGIPDVSYELTLYDKNGDEIDTVEIKSEEAPSDEVATIDTEKHAEMIVDGFADKMPDDHELYYEGSVIFFKYTGDESWEDVDIKVETGDGFGDTAFIAINGQVDTHGELPPYGIPHYPIAVTGNRPQEEGAYYVEWDEEEEIWIETRLFHDFDGEPLPNFLDPSTMPRVMKQDEDGTFVVSEANWKENLVGDEESSPMPSFVDKTINDIFFYRNRLGFLSGENVIFSKVDEYKDFFPESAVLVMDIDPIDITVQSRLNLDLIHAVAFARSLIVFSDQAQFEIGDSGNVLTPETITADPLTYFETQRHCRPVGAGPHVFFPVPKGNYTGIREYFVRTDTLVTDAENVTSHVPEYLPSDLDKLTVASGYDMVFALSSNEQDAIYVNSYTWEENQKVQNSWFKWKFPDEEILDIEVNNFYLILITRYNSNAHLLRIDLRRISDDPLPIKVHLDKLIKTDEGEFYEDDHVTYFDLPYNDPSEDFWVIDAETGLKLSGIEKHNINTVRVTGDHSDREVFIGKLYESTLEYSPFYIQDQEGMPDIQGRLQLKKLAISFEETGAFDVVITPHPRDNIRDYVEGDDELEEYQEQDVITQNHTGIVLGEAVMNTPPVFTGEHTFPVTANAKNVRIELKSYNHLPTNFQLTAYQAKHAPLAAQL